MKTGVILLDTCVHTLRDRFEALANRRVEYNTVPRKSKGMV